MNQLLFDDEEYYFQITDELESDRQFILIIYDIVDNKRRTKFAKLLKVLNPQLCWGEWCKWKR